MTPGAASPYLCVLGVAQDGGVPQAGTWLHRGWRDAGARRCVSCLGIVDPARGLHHLIDATPDFPEQLHMLDTLASNATGAGTPRAAHRLDGVFLTHAHIGHYTGLIHLGHEAMGTSKLPVHAMPRMREFLETNGPWEALARNGHIELVTLTDGESVPLAKGLAVVPVGVPHRETYSETVGFRIDGPERRVLYVPDVDGWDALDAAGTRIESLIASVDVAYLDGTFFDDAELSDRDRSSIGHPTIESSLRRFQALSETDRRKIRFIHLNHTNPVLDPTSRASERVRESGLGVAVEREVQAL